MFAKRTNMVTIPRLLPKGAFRDERPRGVTIRTATRADCAAIAQIVRESFATFNAKHIPADMPIYHPAYHKAAFNDPTVRWALASDATKPVGVAAWRMQNGVAHLLLLFVTSQHQHKGIGVALFRYFQQHAHEENSRLRLYTLTCLRDSAWAMRFYAHNGFTEYKPGDEWRVSDLCLWMDACRAHHEGWPPRQDKALFYKRVQ